MSQPPLVTVLMPVYNGEAYLCEAIDSILNQTYQNFEFLIINDGSTDGSERIILSYTDERIVYEKNPANLKLIATLNKGLHKAKGKYIVRMDADDISMPARIEKQVRFMEDHPEIGVAGAWVHSIGTEQKEVRYETDPDMIKIRMIFSCYLNHPSTIIRTELMRKHQLSYPAEYIHAEDYAFWIDVLKVAQIGMVNEYLLQYRMHDEKIGSKYHDIQVQMSFALRRKQLVQLGEVSDEEFHLFNSWIHAISEEYYRYPNPAKFDRAESFVTLGAFLNRIIEKNNDLKIYHPLKLAIFFSERWKDFCLTHSALGLAVYKSFFKNGFQQYAPIRPFTRALFFGKVLLKLSPRNAKN